MHLLSFITIDRLLSVVVVLLSNNLQQRLIIIIINTTREVLAVEPTNGAWELVLVSKYTPRYLINLFSKFSSHDY